MDLLILSLEMRCNRSVCSTKESSIFNIYERDIFDIPSIHNVRCKFRATWLFVQKPFFWLALNKHHWAVVNGLESLERMTLIIELSLDATQLFVQELIQANNKETINAMSLCSLVICWYPFQNTALVVNLEQLDCLFNRFFRLTTKEYEIQTASLWGEWTWFPRPSI